VVNAFQKLLASMTGSGFFFFFLILMNGKDSRFMVGKILHSKFGC
jgi:hypothetical protein